MLKSRAEAELKYRNASALDAECRLIEQRYHLMELELAASGLSMPGCDCIP